MSLYTPVTENMKLDMRMNLKAKKVVSLLDRSAYDGGPENFIDLWAWHACCLSNPYPVQQAGDMNAETSYVICRWS